jgi:DNA-binding IclR family transcriptional regulator
MTKPNRKPVPAVQNVLEIFEFLRSVGNEPQSLSSIARGAGVNVSTCFNLLKTLESGGLIAFDPPTKAYSLGMRLAELGALADVRRQQQRLALDEARRVSNELGLGCFVMTLSQHEEFLVVDKVDSKDSIRTTIDVGATFPLTGSLASKAWFAWQSEDVIDRILRTHGLHAYTERSITTAAAFKKELAAVRERGYATSEGEYFPDHNAVAAPVFGWDKMPVFLLVVVGTTSQLNGADLIRAGEEVTAAANNTTKKINGRHPRDAT